MPQPLGLISTSTCVGEGRARPGAGRVCARGLSVSCRNVAAKKTCDAALPEVHNTLYGQPGRVKDTSHILFESVLYTTATELLQKRTAPPAGWACRGPWGSRSRWRPTSGPPQTCLHLVGCHERRRAASRHHEWQPSGEAGRCCVCLGATPCHEEPTHACPAGSKVDCGKHRRVTEPHRG